MTGRHTPPPSLPVRAWQAAARFAGPLWLLTLVLAAMAMGALLSTR